VRFFGRNRLGTSQREDYQEGKKGGKKKRSEVNGWVYNEIVGREGVRRERKTRGKVGKREGGGKMLQGLRKKKEHSGVKHRGGLRKR